MTHSFPTRRSSDLAGMYPGGACSDLALAADPFRHPAEGQRHGADRQANENQHADQGEREVRVLRPEMLVRSEEHTSELQSLMRISYAVFCLKKQKNTIQQ